MPMQHITWRACPAHHLAQIQDGGMLTWLILHDGAFTWPTPNGGSSFRLSVWPPICTWIFKKKLRFYLFLERGKGREKESERNINVWLSLACPLLGTWPTTQACALTGNLTSNPLIWRWALNPLSHTSQGTYAYFKCWPGASCMSSYPVPPTMYYFCQLPHIFFPSFSCHLYSGKEYPMTWKPPPPCLLYRHSVISPGYVTSHYTFWKSCMPFARGCSTAVNLPLLWKVS